MAVATGVPAFAGTGTTVDRSGALPASAGVDDRAAAEITRISGCRAITSPGTYVLTGDVVNSSAERCITINASDVVLDGEGHTIDGIDDLQSRGVAIRHGTEALANITVRNLTVTDWRIGIESTGGGGIPENVTDVLVEDVTASSNAADGIQLRGRALRNVELTGNRIRSNGDSGIEIGGSSVDGVVIVDTVATDNDDRGIEAFGDGVVLRNVTALDNGNQGIRLDGEDALVVGTNASANGGPGIQVSSESQRGNNTLIDNVAVANGKGILTDGNGVDLIDNTARENGGKGFGIGTFGDLGTDADGRVVDNTAIDNGFDRDSPGITLGSDTRNYTVYNNTVVSNWRGIASGGDENVITGNTVTGNERRGIDFFEGENNTVADNLVTGNGVGIRVGFASNNTLRGNVVRANDRTGISLGIADGNRLADNVVVSNGEAGIRVSGGLNPARDNVLINNTASGNERDGVVLASTANSTLRDNVANANGRDGIRLDVEVRNATIRDNAALGNGRWAFSTGRRSRNNTVSRLAIASNTTISFRGRLIGLRAGLPRLGDPDSLRDLEAYVNVSTLTGEDPSESWLDLDVHYTDREAAALEESELRMLRWNGSAWRRVPSRNTVDTDRNVVSANVTNVSRRATLVTIFDRTPERTESGPFVDSVSPRLVRGREAVTLTATGRGFRNASVELVSPTGDRLAPTEITRNRGRLEASFALSDPAAGLWRLAVTGPTGDGDSSPVLVPAGEPLVEKRVFWPSRLVPGRRTALGVELHNRGIVGGVAIVGVEFANETGIRGVTNLDAADRVLVNRSHQVVLAIHLSAGESTRIGVRYRLSPDSVAFPGQEPSPNRTVRLGEAFTSGHVTLFGTFNRSEWRAVRDRDPINVSVEAVDRTIRRQARIGRALNHSDDATGVEFMRATAAGSSPAGAYLGVLTERMIGAAWIVETSLSDRASSGTVQRRGPAGDAGHALQEDKPVSPGPGGTLPTPKDAFKQATQRLCKEGPIPDGLVTGAFKTKVGAEATKRLAQAGLRYGGKRFAGEFATVALRAGQVGEAANAVGWALLAAEVGWKTGKEAERQINQYFEAITPPGQEAPTWAEVGGEGIRETYPWLIDGIRSTRDWAGDAKRWVSSWWTDDGQECTQQEPVASIDPNDISVRPGIGDSGHVAGNRTLEYRVRFENKPNATAAARDVTVTVPVDSTLAFDSVETRGVSHPDVVNVSRDRAARTITWTFSGIDLPPNDDPPEGEGWIEFTARPRPDHRTGATVRENASIRFEFNPPIATNEVTRTIDGTPPNTTVEPLQSPAAPEVRINWTGDDGNGSGVRAVTLLAAKGNGSLEAVAQTNGSGFAFQAQRGATYRFVTIAQDRTGNLENAPAEPDATVAIEGCGSPVGEPDVPATDPDGDGDCEDVNGDGSADVLDVALFLEHFDAAAVQDDPAPFDFDGRPGVDILDVAALLEEV